MKQPLLCGKHIIIYKPVLDIHLKQQEQVL